mgnify:FL=1|jgi:hypothetical protein
MNYELTIFKNQFDNKTHRHMVLDEWDKFVKTLKNMYGEKGEKGGNNSSPLISPAVFEVGTTRSNKSTNYWGGWCCVDVDDHSYSSDVRVLNEQLYETFGRYDYVVYNTASSRDDHLKFRIVFRLDETIDNDRIKAFWYALNTELGDIGDPQTKDLARMYYVPAQYPNAKSFFITNQGDPLNTSELIAKHPYHEKTGNTFLDRLPPEMQSAVIQHRKNSLNNTDYRWSSYRDCPFWPKRLGIEYQTINETGWYSKMYKIMIAVAGNAYAKGYPITATQIADLCREFDRETGNWYENRPLTVEADRALEFIYRNS